MVLVAGILNCSPDSFSDGESVGTLAIAVDRAQSMIRDGADIIDIGGDSSRPGSVCVGIEEEWRRIAPILEALQDKVVVSVDTHHAEIARRAVGLGASMINDISGGSDPHMFSVIAECSIRYVAMYSDSGVPHQFSAGGKADSVCARIHAWFCATTERITAAGVERSKLILDTGMGKFLGDDPLSSWEVLRRYGEFSNYGTPLLLGCSRKGFLKQDGESSIFDRDPLSSLCGVTAASKIAGVVPLYLRVHNVSMQRAFIDVDRVMAAT